MNVRIQYSKPNEKGIRKSETYKAENGAEYYILMHEKERWAKIVNAKRRNVIDIVSCSNYNQLRLAARRRLFQLGVKFEIEFKEGMSEHGHRISRKSREVYWAKKDLDK